MRISTKFKSAAIRLFVATLLSTLAACGGSSDGTSSAGGSGGAALASATISGNVNNSLAFNRSNFQESAIASLLNKLVSEAHADGIADVVVELYLGAMLVDSKTTGNSGEFNFSGLIPGNYSISLMQNGQTVGSTPMIELSANTNTRLELNLDGAPIKVEVEATNDQISGEVEDQTDDGVSSDDDSEDDDNSEDDESEDDDESKDDDSED